MLEGLIAAIISSLLGTLGFAMILHAPRRAWLPGSLIGCLGYVLYWLMLQAGAGDPLSMFVSATLASLLAQVCARKIKMIATVFVTLSIIPLVPGLALYRAMRLLGEGLNSQGAQVGINAMIAIVMMAFGLAVGSFIFRMIMSLRSARRNSAQ